MNVQWLDRSLLQGPRVALVTSAAGFRRATRSFGMDDDGPWLAKYEQACVHSYDTADGLVCIVALSLDACSRLEPIDIAALLAHEAVHVWQRVEEMMPGASLGREMEAYAVQNIAANLMRAYLKASSSAAGRASAA